VSQIRCSPFGTTRSCIQRNYAVITPDTYVMAPLVGWKNASTVIHISPEMGARFTQYTTIMHADSISASPGPKIERCLFVLDGVVTLSMSDSDRRLTAGGFAFLPAGTDHQLVREAGDGLDARLAVFEKHYQPSESAGIPEPRVGRVDDVLAVPFMGDPALALQALLPAEPAYDMAVNVFTFQPGATLPQVEIHVMEHGLLMLDGAGVYRLGNDYHPVQAGDVIWMASYCPQWFVAMGKEATRYLYYKDIQRDRLSEKQASVP
jgi:(S)-ureidoglycine aminohydrolase